MTSEEIKPIVSPVVALDPAFFEGSLQYVEDTIIKKALTPPVYDDMIAKIAALPAPPLSTADQELYDRIKPFEAYTVAFAGYSKDLERKTNNQGMMENHTQWSKSAAATSAKRTLANISQRSYDYAEILICYMMDNAADYPLLVVDDIDYEPNLRRYFPI